ncbi:MAG TPA: zinc ribbon domain-containing protein [Kofleriaceae bacterium]|jgi:putative FmdB family regulatory protein
MPTYEYRCNACEREFEYQQKMDDPDLVTCEACGAAKLERLISWTSVRSDTWRAALKADNPKEAFRGIHAVDRSTVQRFKGNDAAAPDAEAPAAAPASSEASEPAAPSVDDDSSKT